MDDPGNWHAVVSPPLAIVGWWIPEEVFMKRALLLIAVLAMIFTSPYTLGEQEDPDGGTTIISYVDRDFVFSHPSDHFIKYKKLNTDIGETSLSDLFLYDGEGLSIEVETEPMKHKEKNDKELPFTVECKELPEAVYEDGRWDVIVRVAKEHWEETIAGDYEGYIYFTVVSTLDGETLATGVTKVYTTVPEGGIINPGTGSSSLILLAVALCAAGLAIATEYSIKRRIGKRV